MPPTMPQLQDAHWVEEMTPTNAQSAPPMVGIAAEQTVAAAPPMFVAAAAAPPLRAQSEKTVTRSVAAHPPFGAMPPTQREETAAPVAANPATPIDESAASVPPPFVAAQMDESTCPVAPPPVVAPPPAAQMDETTSRVALPPVVAPPPAAQIGETTSPAAASPFVAVPPAAQVEELTSRTAPSFVAANIPPPVADAVQSLGTGFGAPAYVSSSDRVSPEDEVPESDQQSDEHLDESPEETVAAQEDVTEQVELPPEEQHSQPALSQAWSEEIDPSSGRTYYYNSETGESSWERPPVEDEIEETSFGQEEEAPIRELPPEQTFSQEAEEDQRGDDALAEAPHEEETSQSPGALPPGWSEEVDPSTGMSYYYNAEAGVSSWERPASEERKEKVASVDDDEHVANESALPEGWAEEFDEMSGQTYFYHAESNVTTWERPSAEASMKEALDAEESKGDKATPPAMEGEGESKEEYQDGETEQTGPEAALRNEPVDERKAAAPLPTGWSEHIDPASGKPYYVNSAENVTSWERPSMPLDSSGAAEDESDAIAEPPLIPRATDQNDTDSLPESTTFAASTGADGSTVPEDSEAEPSDQPASIGELSAADSRDRVYAELSLDQYNGEDNLGPGESHPETAAEASTGGLPEEWEELMDPDSGRVYYYNVVEGTSTWNRPVATAAAQSQERTTSETELSNADTGNPPETRGPESTESWNLVSSQDSLDAVGDQTRDGGNPEVHVESDVAAVADRIEPNEQPEKDAFTPPGLPPNWTESIDPASGIPYYFNELTNETSWDRPVIDAVEAEEEIALDEVATVSTEAEQVMPQKKLVESTDVTEPNGDNGMESNGLALGVESTEADDKNNGESENAHSAVEAETTFAPLLPGWVALVDSSTGQTYYYNESEGTTSWERPVANVMDVGEEEKVAGEGGTDMKLVSEDVLGGELPVSETADDGFGLSDGSMSEMAPAVDNEAEEDQHEDVVTPARGEDKTEEILPPGWVEMIDPSSGKPYYVNDTDNTTTWERPVTAPVGSDAKATFEEPQVASRSKAAGHGPHSAAIEQDTPSVFDREDEGTQEVTESTLPSGWVELIDLPSGLPYYFNETENLTTWDRPEPVRVEMNDSKEIPPSSHEYAAEAEDDITGGYTMVEHSETASREEPEGDNASRDIRRDGQTELPPGWLELIDEVSGASYYLNETENITTWERPSAAPSGVTEKGNPHVEATPKESSASPPQESMGPPIEISPLQEGWSEIVDPGSGQSYYFNEESGETTWDRPIAPTTRAFTSSGSKITGKSDSLPPARVFATFGFGGRLCVWKAKAPSTVVIYRTGYILKEDPVVVAEQKKKENNVVGPLNSCEDDAVLKHIDSKTTIETTNEAPSQDLLWSLALIAAKSNGRLRSDDGVRNPRSPEAGIVSLLLDEDIGFSENALCASSEAISQDDGEYTLE